MLIKIGKFEIEVTRGSLFVALPGIGQAFIAGEGLTSFDSWKEVKRAAAVAATPAS